MTHIPDSMTAYRIHEFGGPEVLRHEDVHVPSPDSKQVLIEVAYCGVCRHDLLTRAGAFQRAQLPVTLGHQVSGRVVAVGDSADSFSVGDRVMTMIYTGCGTCEQCTAGMEALCSAQTPAFLGEDHDGGYAQYVAVNASTVIALPDEVALLDAAIATCTLGTAYHALFGRGGLAASHEVLITGASGGVGLHAVQIARAAGAHVTAVVSTEGGAQRAEAMGAGEVIVSPDRSFAKKVRGRLGGQVDLVLEILGAPTLRESLHAVRAGGRLVVLGNVEGKEVAIPPAYLILKEISLIGTKSCSVHEMQEVLGMLAGRQVQADVSEVVPLSEVGEVHRRMESGEASGRIVLEVKGG